MASIPDSARTELGVWWQVCLRRSRGGDTHPFGSTQAHPGELPARRRVFPTGGRRSVHTPTKPARDASSRDGARTWQQTARRHWRALSIVAALAVATILALLLWPTPAPRHLPPPRARVYLAFDA